MKNRKSFRGHQIVLNMILLVVVAALLVFIVVLVRNKLLQNAQSLGNALVHSYAVEEEMSINSLEREVELVSQYVDELSGDGGGFDAIQSWLSGHFSKLIQTLGPGMVDLYAVVDGQIVAANPWEGDKTYQYQDTDWYRQAVEAGGDVVCGEVYDDAVTGQRIFTIPRLSMTAVTYLPWTSISRIPHFTTQPRRCRRTAPTICVIPAARSFTR